MKHLTKFVNYIIESKGIISNEDFDALIIPFSHMGISVNVQDDKTSTVDEFKGRKYKTIYFGLSKIKENNGFAGGSQNYISDDKIWEFFDELLNLRNHLGTKVLINFGRSTHGGWYCNISYLVGEDIESGDQFELLRVYDQLKKKQGTARTDFNYGMVSKLSGDEILITVSYEYTKRKWKLFVREIDLSNFDVNIIENGSSAEIKIKHK
jgi:hypothetical protein